MSNAESPFLMSILETHPNKHKRGGLWVEGQILRGKVKIGDEVEIVGFSDYPILSKVIMFDLYSGKPSRLHTDKIKILIESVDLDPFGTGRVLAQPKTISAHDRCLARIKVLSESEGGRTKPFYSGFRPQFFIYETNFVCEITLPEETPSAESGWEGVVDIKLAYKIALEIGSRFELREGAKVSVQGEVQNISDF
ncbi:MAG: hypothetical protein DPW16_19760 [Chloroflexi bacterium]|nr:hypothetical protein [Chloroflexota bacterium]